MRQRDGYANRLNGTKGFAGRGAPLPPGLTAGLEKEPGGPFSRRYRKKQQTSPGVFSYAGGGSYGSAGAGPPAIRP